MLTKIAFFSPYPELQEAIRIALEKRSNQQNLKLQYTTANIAINNTNEIDSRIDCDVIIARGYTAQHIRDTIPDIPCIEIRFSIHDIFRAIEECIYTYPGKRIGIIGRYLDMSFLRAFPQINGHDICFYAPAQMEELGQTIDRAICDQCDVLIGGYSVNLILKEKNFPHILLRSGEEALNQAIDEAIKLVEAIRQEREKNEIFQTMMQLSDDGIVYADYSGKIELANQHARQLLNTDSLVGKKIYTVMPFVQSHWDEILSAQQPRLEVVAKSSLGTFSLNYHPVIIAHQTRGVMVFFKNVTDIIRQRNAVYKKLESNGLTARYSFQNIIYSSSKMKRVIELGRSYGKADSNVLIQGETGTGKELMAQGIHNSSNRCWAPFIAVNCSAFQDSLFESELFGYSPGAFTGSSKEGKIGLFELADNGTLFLDEVSELPITLQSKLLRVLQEREVRRIGDNKIHKINVRIISATNKDLAELVAQGKFRRDLLYRLEILKLVLPPLRERTEDIPLLLQNFIAQKRECCQSRVTSLTPAAISILQQQKFEGNVRELGNLVERMMVIYASKDTLDAVDVYETLNLTLEPTTHATQQSILLGPSQTINEADQLKKMLLECKNNKTLAAEKLGINRSTLWRKLKKYKIL